MSAGGNEAYLGLIRYSDLTPEHSPCVNRVLPSTSFMFVWAGRLYCEWDAVRRCWRLIKDPNNTSASATKCQCLLIHSFSTKRERGKESKISKGNCYGERIKSLSPCVCVVQTLLETLQELWELCVLRHPIISLMSRPQEGGERETASRTEKDRGRKWVKRVWRRVGVGETETSSGTFSSSLLQTPFTPTPLSLIELKLWSN